MAQLSLHTLRGKQSVRVTFKLAPETSDLLSVMASQLGIKQKTLFDHLIEQQEFLHHVSQPKTRPETQPRRQKTFVLSQETVETLNQLAKQHHAPRNLLVEMAVQRLLPILTEEQEKHEKRKMLLGKIGQETARTRRLLEQAKQLLEEDDPITREIREASQSMQKTYANSAAIIERGKGMEDLMG